MKNTKLGLYVTGIVIAFCAIPYSRAQTAPGVSIPAVPTNLPNIRTFVPPPKTFNPIAASAEALQQHGFPPCPDQLKAPAAYKAWAKAVSAPQTRLQSPQLEQTTVSNGPARVVGNGTSVGNIIATQSSNWSAYVAYNHVVKPWARGAAYAYWIVPVARQAFGTANGTWDYSSQWVGLDGFGSPDVLQAGTEADAIDGTSSFYAAWVEWYPLNEDRISNFAVSPGDEMFVQVWNTSPTVGNAYLLNVSTQQAVSLTFDAASGTSLVGNSVEWVVERPSLGGSLATLTNYVACPFDACYAFGSVGGGILNKDYYPGMDTAVLASNTTIYELSMLDNSSAVISVPSLVGLADIWFRDTGSAY
jgi:hypothetical protein